MNPPTPCPPGNLMSLAVLQVSSRGAVGGLGGTWSFRLNSILYWRTFFGIRVRATAVMSSAGAGSFPEVVSSVPMIDGEMS